MKSYGQFCPVAKAAELFCERWTALILRDLAGGATRFSELQRGVPLASPTILSRRIRQLEAEGVVERRRSSSGRSWTYHLTPAGREFAPIVEALGIWGQRWSRRELAEHEIDLGLLVWAMEKSVRPEAFSGRRTIVAVVVHRSTEEQAQLVVRQRRRRLRALRGRPGIRGRPPHRRDTSRHDLHLARRPDARAGTRYRSAGGARHDACAQGPAALAWRCHRRACQVCEGRRRRRSL